MPSFVEVILHFGHLTWPEAGRWISAGGIWKPQCGQGVASDARTFSRLIFRRAGIRGFYRVASLPSGCPDFAVRHLLEAEA